MIECCVAGTTRGCNDCLVSLQFGRRLHTRTLVATCVVCTLQDAAPMSPIPAKALPARLRPLRPAAAQQDPLLSLVMSSPHTDSVQLCCEHVFLHDSRAIIDNEDNSTASGSAAADTTSAAASSTFIDMVHKKRKANPPLKAASTESPLAPDMRVVHRKAARLNVLR